MSWSLSRTRCMIDEKFLELDRMQMVCWSMSYSMKDCHRCYRLLNPVLVS